MQQANLLMLSNDTQILKARLCILFFLSQSQSYQQCLPSSSVQSYRINIANITMTMTGKTKYNAPPLLLPRYSQKYLLVSIIFQFKTTKSFINVIDGSIKKILLYFQMEIAKRLNAIIAQLLPFLSQEVRLHCSLKENEYRISIYFSVTVF